MTPTDTTAKKRVSLKKFRRGSHRYDFYASPESHVWIEKLRAEYPQFTVSRLIDDVFRRGIENLFPAMKM